MKLKIVAILAGLFLIGSFLIPGGSSVNVKNLYEEAEKAFQEKRYQEAINKYEEALAEGEKWGADTAVIDEDFGSLANFKIATCYSKLAEQLEDPTMYEKSLELIPPVYEKTKVDLQREGLIFLWGHNYYKLERYEEAEPKFRELLNDYPDSQFAEEAYYSLGRLYYELNRYEQSREAFKMILDNFPNSGKVDDAQYFIAKCFYDEGNYDQSYLEFEKVQVVDNPELLAQSRYYGALSLKNIGRNQEALTEYQKFIADFPESPFVTPAYFDMGAIHGKLKEYDEATRNYELAIQHAEDEVTKSEIQYSIGNNYFEQGDFQAAIAAYQRLMDEYPESLHIPAARLYIADSYWNLDDYESAMAGYNEVLEKDPESENIPYSVYKIGECYYKMDDKEMALEWYDRVINEYPDSPVVKDATYSKIWAFNDLKRYEEAETVGRDYIEKYKTDPVYDIAAAETQVILGDIKFDAEDYITAADEYLRVPADYGDLPKFDLFKSKAFLQAGLAYYREAERNNWDIDLLSKAADAFSQLVNNYEVNFNKERRDFEFRQQYVSSAVTNLALSYSEMKEYQKARDALDLMPKDSPEYGSSVFLKGKMYQDEGNIDDAVTIYRQVIDDQNLTETARSQAAIQMAGMLAEAGRHAEAAVEYQRIVEQYPDSDYAPNSMYLIGSSYYDMEPKTPENMNKAIEAFKAALEKYPDADTSPWSHLGILWAYEALDDYGMVINVADEIENQYADSNIPDAKKVVDRARKHKVDAMEKLEEGVSTDVLMAELRKVVADPAGDQQGKASAQLRIGNLLFADKRYEEAIKEYETLLEKFPGEHTGASYYQIAAAAFWIDDYQKAVASAQKGLTSPDLTQLLKTGLNYTLGLAYHKLMNLNDSIASLKQAIQMGEGAEEQQTKDLVFAAHRELARVYGEAKQFTGAIEEYKFLAENAPTDSERTDASFWLAKTYEENLQDYQSAVEYYEKVKELNTSDDMTASSLYYMGLAYSKHLEDGEKALESLQELVSRYSDYEDSNVQLMITDANLRIPGLLVELGKFDDAVARAKQVRDAALAGDDDEEKVNAQYQVAYLLGEQASQAIDSGSMDPALSRQAAAEYARVYELAKPVLNKEEVKAWASASLYNAGYLLYQVGEYEDYAKATDYFENFVRDFKGSENYAAALEILGIASYEAARLKADLDGFARTAQFFLRFAKEFPDQENAASSQFQAGESYFAVAGGHSGNAEDATDPNVKATEMSLAVDAYRKAIPAYRGVADNWPDSEYAPEALYVMAACYMYIAEALTDESAKQKELEKMSAAYKELAEKYPQSEHAAKAFLSVGNDYFNQASAPGVATEDRTNFYRLSLDNYRRALQVPGIDNRSRMAVESYIKETEELLAKDIYNVGSSLVPLPETESEREQVKEKVPGALPYFKEVIEKFPNTDYADLSYVQLGMCYEYLEDWENSEKAYGDLIKKYTDENGNPISPFSENVVRAVAFARKRKGDIMAYRLSLKAQQQANE